MYLKRFVQYRPNLIWVKSAPGSQIGCDDPLSAAYYEGKWAEEKRHNAAVMYLARRQLNAVFPIDKVGAFYEQMMTAVA